MKNKKAFTLIELIVVIAILGILAAIILVVGSDWRKKARDTERVSFFGQLSDALEDYYEDYGHYPAVGGGDNYAFDYSPRNSDGSCTPGSSIYLRYDNSNSEGFLAELYNLKYLPMEGWRDPLETSWGDYNSRNNCRYIIPRTDCGYYATKQNICLYCDSKIEDDGDCSGTPDPGVYDASQCKCKPQKYFLHCQLEVTEPADGGTHPEAFERFSPDPWICLDSIPAS